MRFVIKLKIPLCGCTIRRLLGRGDLGIRVTMMAMFAVFILIILILVLLLFLFLLLH